MDGNNWNRVGAFTAVTVSLLVAACGGGGGGGSDSGATTDSSGGNPEPATRLQAGSFLTTVARDQSGTEDNGITFLSPTGKFMTALPGSISFGTLTFDDGDINGVATDFIAQESSWEQVDGEVSGVVESEGLATLDGTAPGFTSSINLDRQQAFSDQGVTFADMNHTFSMYSEGSIVASITVDADGGFTGTDTAGCDLIGQMSIPDNTVNIFEVEYTAGNCEDSSRATAAEHNIGPYTGLGTYDPEEAVLEFAANNGEVAWLFIGERDTGG